MKITANNKRVISFVKNKWDNNSFIWIIFLISFYLGFKAKIVEYYDYYIVDSILQYFRPSILFDIILYLLFVIIIFRAIHRFIDNYQISINFWLVSILLTVIYLEARVSGNYLFYKIELTDFIGYSDILFLFPILTTLYLVRNIFNYFSYSQKTHHGFLTDEPIEHEEQDLYSRVLYATKLAEEINRSYVNRSMAIGINGKWGSGKTSFLNLLKKQLNGPDNIIIEFNPWSNISDVNVVVEFFSSFKKSN